MLLYCSKCNDLYLYQNYVKFAQAILILEPHTHSVSTFQARTYTNACESINLGICCHSIEWTLYMKCTMVLVFHHCILCHLLQAFTGNNLSLTDIYIFTLH